MLLSNENGMIRVLQTKGDRSLVIDCIKRTMPKWIATEDLAAYAECSEADLYDRTGMIQDRELTQEEQRIAQEHFTMIAAVLPFVGNEPRRNEMIELLSEHQSRQTIRKYLCLYLVYQNLAALAPVKKADSKELTQDEKNMRWGLNKFFYTQHKNSLNTAYTLMLQARYCNAQGQLVAEYPSFNQFRYFYRKTKKMQQFYISRDGLKHYQRNNRPLLGDGVQQFAPAVGVGMLDSTICDIYLVDNGGKLVGRPVMTACVDAFSGLCCGYSLGWEGGTYSLRGLMLNVITDKREWCRSHGVFIEDGEWDACQMPGVLVTDMGSEYKGDTFSQVPQYVRFLPVDRRRTALEYVIARDIRYNDAIYKRKGKPLMRYCPLCAAADRQRHGETYWHRKAQLVGVNICLEHRCRLVDSTVGLAVEGLRFKFVHAEFVIPQDTAADFHVSDLEYRAAEYVMKVFDAPMDYENDVLIGKFLKSRLEGTKYTSLRGEQVFARILHNDLREYYHDLLPPTLIEWYHAQKIFCSQTFHTYDICLVAMFLGISVEDLLNPTIPQFTSQHRFDARLRLLRSQGMTQKAAAAVMGVSIHAVKAVEEQRSRSAQKYVG